MKDKETETKKKNGNPISHFTLMKQLDELREKSQEVRHQIEVQKEQKLNGHA